MKRGIFLIGILLFSKLVYAQFSTLVPSTQQESAAFGYHIAHEGDWLLVGAKTDSTDFGITGAAYFFKRTLDSWIEVQKVIPDVGADGDLFGISVSISGDYAVVAANGDDTQGINGGAAYVYKLEGDHWNQHQKLLPHQGTGFDEYGIGVSMKDNLMVVGAYSDNENGPFSGAAYIYRLVNDNWVEEAKILPDDGASDDKFGRSVHTDGEQVIVCGVLNDDLGDNSGSAYIYIKDNNEWIQEVKLLSPDGAANDRFGRSVGIGLEYAAVGSVLDDDNGSKSGSVYIYHKVETGWEYQAKITPDDGRADDFFGYALSLYKNHLVVGAHNDDDFGLNSGSAYLFTRSGTSWLQIEKFHASNPYEGENFGEAVHIDDNWISFGTPYGLKGDVTTGYAEVVSAPVTTSLDSETFDAISIYPNPAGDFIIIDNPTLEVDKIRIYGLNGREEVIPILNSKGKTDISNLKPGVYILRLDEGVNIYYRRFIKIN